MASPEPSRGRSPLAAASPAPRFASPPRGRAFLGSPTPRRPASRADTARSEADFEQQAYVRPGSPLRVPYPVRPGSPIGLRFAAVDEIVTQRHVAAGQSAELQARPARDGGQRQRQLLGAVHCRLGGALLRR